MEDENRLAVLIADDHPIVREGLRRIVERTSDLVVVGEASDASTLIDLCQSLAPRVVLLDISMPGPGFLETLRRFRDELTEVRVLVLSVHPEVEFGFRALEAGAAGFVSKERAPELLEEAIRCVADGRRFVSEALVQKLAQRNEGTAAESITERLSPREYEVFLMLGAGRSVTQIASALDLSPKTVSTHRARILEKTGLRSTAEIIRFAVGNQLVE